MGTALNGMALHGGLHVFGGTFFVFSDYVRPAIRLSAIMGVPVTYVFTHDSVAVGEDGATHEPVEHLLHYVQCQAYQLFVRLMRTKLPLHGISQFHPKTRRLLLVLSRQNLPVLPKSAELAMEGVKKGAYIVSPASKEKADAILIATGSEVSLAVSSQAKL